MKNLTYELIMAKHRKLNLDNPSKFKKLMTLTFRK